MNFSKYSNKLLNFYIIWEINNTNTTSSIAIISWLKSASDSYFFMKIKLVKNIVQIETEFLIKSL